MGRPRLTQERKGHYLNLGKGEATPEKVFISESSVVNVKRGSAFLYGTLAKTVEAQCKEEKIQNTECKLKGTGSG